MADPRNLGAEWTAIHAPVANTKATVTKAASGYAQVRNICRSLTVTLAATNSAPAAIQLQVSLIDGASGGGTLLWTTYISLPAVAGAMSTIALGNLWIAGSKNTAMTLEFSASGGNNTIESVSMNGLTGT